MLGVPAPGVPHFTEPSVVVAEDLAPAETATLDRSLVVGIVTQAGGRTSHTAILAAQMGIPAVVQLAGATGIPPGTPVALDGDTGEVTIAPDISLVEAQRVRREKRAEALAAGSGPGVTRDGHHIALLANIGGVQDAEAAGAQDLEGVGLFRTEFVFLSADRAPTVEEQAEIYRQVFRPSATAGSSCAPWMPAPTSPWRSPTSAPRRTLPSAVAGCGCRPSGPSCSTPSSRRSRSPPRTPAPTCASWRRWWRRSRRRRGSPGGSARTGCRRPGS